MASKNILLKNGQNLEVQILEPPLQDAYRSVIWWSFVQDELLGGDWSETLHTVYFIGLIEGEKPAALLAIRHRIREI